MAICNLCKTEGAYVGIRTVECVNVKCANFSEKQLESVTGISRNSDNKSVDCADPVDQAPYAWMWNTHFYDYGD